MADTGHHHHHDHGAHASGHVSAHNPGAGQGPVVLDIGEDVGALVLHARDDMVGREIVVPRSKALDQTVIVDNKPGAGGTIGGAEMARSAPDGYTLMLANSAPLSIGQIVGETVKMDLELNMTHVP